MGVVVLFINCALNKGVLKMGKTKNANGNAARLARAKTAMAAIKSALPKGTVTASQTVRVTAKCARLQPAGIVCSCFARATSVQVIVPVLGVKALAKGTYTLNRNGQPQVSVPNGSGQKAALAAIGGKIANALKS